MNHGSLFSGIGGFDLAAEWMKWNNVFHCEWNPFGQKILKHYWPDAQSYHDITKSDFTIHRGQIDILSGGFPCQPYSSAGKRLGKEDDRHLWPEMLRAIREIQPRWVVGENVRGLTNWNGGMVFDEVQADLENEGYEVTPFLLPACGVGAPHRRDRIWFVAFNPECKPHGGSRTGQGGENGLEMVGNFMDSSRREQSSNDAEPSDKNGSSSNSTGIRRDHRSDYREERSVQDDIWSSKEDKSEREGWFRGAGSLSPVIANAEGERLGEARSDLGRPEERITGSGSERTFADSDEFNGDLSGLRTGEISQLEASSIRKYHASHAYGQQRREGRLHQTEREATERHIGAFDSRNGRGAWKNFPTQSPVRSGNDGFPSGLDGITISKWRNESIKAAGNAIVPQVAYQIFQSIQQYENNSKF